MTKCWGPDPVSEPSRLRKTQRLRLKFATGILTYNFCLEKKEAARFVVSPSLSKLAQKKYKHKPSQSQVNTLKLFPDSERFLMAKRKPE